jgi:hypothetical protein
MSRCSSPLIASSLLKSIGTETRHARIAAMLTPDAT